MAKAALIGGAALLLFAGALAQAQDGAISSPSPALYSDLRWRELGPFRGGWATVVDGVPSEPDTFYFGAAGGGVWKTRDAGRTWEALFQHGPAASIGALAVAPSNPSVVYIGTGQPEPRYDVGAGLGVFKSIDGGAHWTPLGLENTRTIGRIWVDPKNANVVLVGAQGHFFGPSPDRGIYRSTDGGKTWSHVLKPDDWTGVVDFASDPKNPKIIFASAWEAHQYPWQSYFTPVAGSGSAIYKSTDEGVTWTRLSGGGWPASKLGRIGLAAARVGKNTRLYASVDSEKEGGLYRSDDGGARWSWVNKTKAFAGWYSSRLTVAPDNPDVVYTVGQSIRRCDEGGKHCTIVKGAPGGDDYHHVWINPLHPDHMITGSDQGAVVSVDGGATWSSWYNEPTGQFYHLAADNRFPYWIYSGQQDSGTVGIASRSDYGELTYRDWHPVGGEERDYDIPDPTDPSIIYGSGLGGHVSKWDAHTGQVADITPWPEDSYGKRPTIPKYHYLWVTPLVASNTGAQSLYLGAQVLFRSQDQGKSWSVISGDLTGKRADAKNCDGDVSLAAAKDCGYGTIATIATIAPSARHADEIWVGTDDGLVQLTRDGGAHWTDVTPPGIALWAKVQSIDLSAQEDGVAYATADAHRVDDFQPHVFRTRDYGKSWQEIDNGLPRDHFVSVVRTDPVKTGLLYAGTDNGVFVSFDDGAHWMPLQQNLPSAWVTDLLVHGDDLIAATEGRSIWVLDDVAPLREIASGFAGDHLFDPAPVIRVHPDNNKDTPLPPETPAGENPPAGAIIDYWLDPYTIGPVTLEIHDSGGHLVRRFSSADVPTRPKAERYFAKDWLAPLTGLSGAPGMHRFVWDLRYERPDAVSYGYSIAAVWGRGDAINPAGPFALPGNYIVVLEANGKRYSAPLAILEDPRVSVTPDDLRSSLALSQKIAAGMAEASAGYREQEAVRNVLNARFPKEGSKLDTADLALVDRLRAKEPEGHPTFQLAAHMLSGVESSLESADVAPTAIDQQVVDEALVKLDTAKSEWTTAKAGPLAELNASLVRAGQKPIEITNADLRKVEEPDEGEDLP